MIEKTSGQLFRFRLDFNLGFGFAEAYDFRDVHSADGTKIFVYNRIDSILIRSYNLLNITASGISLGPISLYAYPHTRGVHCWKFLGKKDDFILGEPPITKESQNLAPWIYDWSTIDKWHKSNWNPKAGPEYLPYAKIRSLETRVLNSVLGVAKKATMKLLIDSGKNVGEHYDLKEQGNVNMFIQLINTYYPLKKCQQLIKLIPQSD